VAEGSARRGPLTGIRVIELAGLGADVIEFEPPAALPEIPSVTDDTPPAVIRVT